MNLLQDVMFVQDSARAMELGVFDFHLDVISANVVTSNLLQSL
jgi:hypothetical protein